MVSRVGVLVFLVCAVRARRWPCGTFPIDRANREGPCVSESHLFRVSDGDGGYAVNLPDLDLQEMHTLAPARMDLNVNATCAGMTASSGHGCRVLLQHTNYWLHDAGVFGDPTHTRIGLGPQSEVWATFARVEICAHRQRLFWIRHACVNACWQCLTDSATHLDWRARGDPATDPLVMPNGVGIAVNATHWAPMVPTRMDLRDISLVLMIELLLIPTLLCKHVLGVDITDRWRDLLYIAPMRTLPSWARALREAPAWLVAAMVLLAHVWVQLDAASIVTNSALWHYAYNDPRYSIGVFFYGALPALYAMALVLLALRAYGWLLWGTLFYMWGALVILQGTTAADDMPAIVMYMFLVINAFFLHAYGTSNQWFRRHARVPRWLHIVLLGVYHATIAAGCATLLPTFLFGYLLRLLGIPYSLALLSTESARWSLVANEVLLWFANARTGLTLPPFHSLAFSARKTE